MSYDLTVINPEQWRQQLEEMYRSAAPQTLWIVWGVCAACVLLAVFFFIAWCRIFMKAGLPWERMFVPVYGDFWQYNIADSGWIFWLLLACGIFAAFLPVLFRSLLPLPIIGLVILVLQIIYLRKLAAAFGRGVWFTLGLIFLHPLFILILGFGGSQFSGPRFASRGLSQPQPRWTCACGKQNPASKTTCINCGRPRP